MERLKITEAIGNLMAKGESMDWPKFLDHVFPDHELGKGRLGGRPLGRIRKRQLISYWDKGLSLTRCHPSHILRIAEFFGLTLLKDIVYVPETKTRRKAQSEQP